MTYKELYLKEHPECEDIDDVIRRHCPGAVLEGVKSPECEQGFIEGCCPVCWNKEIPEETEGFKSEELVPVGEEIAKGIEEGITEPKTSVNFDAAEFQKKIYEALGISEKTVDKINAIGFPYPVSPKEIADGMLANKSGVLKRSDIQKAVEDLNKRYKGAVEAEERAATIKDSVPVYFPCPHYDMTSKTCGDHMEYERCVCGGDMTICDFFPEKREKAKQMVDTVDKAVNESTIKDSGTRREFATGAVRDIQEGKGRCDLMPLDVVGHLMYDDPFLFQIHEFTKDGDPEHLICALQIVAKGNGYPWLSISSMMLDAAKHFEAGAKKYGEWNWQKGIPTHCYIDSAVRHFLKCACGYNDEPHDRAFVWNILCCIWTCKHKPELNDYPRKEKK